jgi:molybdopterin-guanine dinucleotide biosynthesis protein
VTKHGIVLIPCFDYIVVECLNARKKTAQHIAHSRSAFHRLRVSESKEHVLRQKSQECFDIAIVYALKQLPDPIVSIHRHSPSLDPALDEPNSATPEPKDVNREAELERPSRVACSDLLENMGAESGRVSDLINSLPV